MSTEKQGFIVAQILGYGSLQPVFSDDDGLMFFDTVKEAEAEIDDCIEGVADAIQSKHMDEDSRLSRNDYAILPATLAGDIIFCEDDGEGLWMHCKDDDWKKIKDHHPEMLEGEFWVTNSDERDYGRISWTTRRKGFIAYDMYGKPLGSRWPGAFPVFAQKSEFESKYPTYTTERPKESGWYLVKWTPKDEPIKAWIFVTEFGLSWGRSPEDDPEALELDIAKPEEIQFSKL